MRASPGQPAGAACIQRPSTEYAIVDRTIWSRSRGSRAARYTGSDPHDKQIHISVGHSSSREDSSRAWGIANSTAPKLGDRTLRNGSKESDVRELQILANKAGARLAVDGAFGPATLAWVRSFQKAGKLTVDGIVGPKTVAALRAATKPKPAPTPTGHRPGTRTGAAWDEL